jgi:hypothetical protein
MDQLETAARNYKNALKTGDANTARKKYKSALVHAELSTLSPKRVAAIKSELKQFKSARAGLLYTVGTHVGEKAAKMAAAPPKPKPKTAQGPGAARRFLTGFLNRGASHQALAQYAKMAARATKASPNSEKNFLQIFEAGAGLNKSGTPLGRRIGAPTRRLIEKVVFPQLQGPAPPPNPVVNNFINELKDVNLSGPLTFLAPDHAANLGVIVARARNISRPTRPLNKKRENSEAIGVALAHIINRLLGRLYKEGPGQPTKQGVIIGGIFKGLLSTNKNGTATWASKFLANKFGNRDLHPELKRLLVVLLKKSRTADNGRQFVRDVVELYRKMPRGRARARGAGPKEPVGNRFIDGIIDKDVARVAQFVARPHPVVLEAARVAHGFKNKSLAALAVSGALKVPGVRKGLLETLVQGTKGLGRMLRTRNAQKKGQSLRAIRAARTLAELKRVPNVNDETVRIYKQIKETQLRSSNR